MNNQSVFLISTPLQLMNAMEARKYFNLSASVSKIIIMAYAANLEMIKKLLIEEEWASIHYLEESVERQKKHESNLNWTRLVFAFNELLERRKKLGDLVNRIGDIQYLFVGYYLSLENLHFINSTTHKEIVLLDDGIATLEINRRRTQKISVLDAWSFEFLFKALLKRIVFGYRLIHPKSVTYFTIYDLNIPPFDKIIVNDYSTVRKLMGNKSEANKVYFLGQPLSEIKPYIVKEERYIEYIVQVIKYFKPLKVIYIPHKDESVLKINRLKDQIGIEVQKIDVPFEWYLINVGHKPDKIAGLVTSALPNCKVLFGSEIEIISFRIKKDELIKSGITNSILDTYDYFEKLSDTNFKIVDL